MTVLSVIERFLGFLYRIVLSRSLGSEGLGLYQIALSVFGVLVTLTSSGIPITVSRLMQKYRAEGKLQSERAAVTAGIAVSLIMSLPVFCLLFFGSSLFSFIFSDPRCMTIFLIMMPGLVFTSVYAVIRGVFWGNKDFMPYSVIELLEELAMIVAGVVLVSRATDVYSGAQRAAFAIVISYVFSFTLSLVVFFVKGGKLASPAGQFKPLLSSALPITGMRTTNSLVNSLIAILLPLQLISAGMTQSEALSEFGAAFGMAVPLLFIPSTVIGSLALVLVPELAENYYKNQHATLRKNIEKAIKFSALIAGLIVPVFLSQGTEIGVIVYGDAKAGTYLAVSSVVMLPMSVMMITQSLLNSLGLEKKTLMSFLCGAAIMLLCVVLLPYVIGVYALAVGFLLSYTVTAALNLRMLHKKCVDKPKYLKFVGMVALFILPSALLGFGVKRVLALPLGAFFSCFVSSLLTLLFTLGLYYVTGLADVTALLARFKRKKDKQKNALS